METIVIMLMLLVCFTFAIKSTFLHPVEVLLVSVFAALFAGFMWKTAITQSKAQISSWLSDSALMLNTAVILSVEVLAQIAFAFLSASIDGNGVTPIRKHTMITYHILRLFPGILVFAVIFSALTYLIFSLPGANFRLVAWGFGGALLLIIPLCRFVMLRLIPEKDLRTEVFFIANLFVAAVGVIATVNGTTAVAGTNEVNIGALFGVLGITLVCASVGILFFFKKT